MTTFDIKQRSYEFSLEIVKFVRSFEYERGFQPVLDQLLRCGTSVGANIHEGFSASSKKDFINYYNIALKAANETLFWLDIILSTFPDKKIIVDKLSTEATELAKIIATIVTNSRKSLD